MEYIELEKFVINDKNSFAGGPFGSNLKTCDYTDTGIPIIQLSNITEDYLNFDNRLVFTSVAKANELKTNNAFPGDMIIAKMMPAGRACLATTQFNRYVLGSDAIRVALDTNKCNPYFIREQINSPTIKKIISSKTAGSTRQRIGIPELKKLKLFVPSVEEQNKIGYFLKILDFRIETQSKIIKEYKTLKNAIINQLIFNNSNLDEKMKLSRFATLRNGYAFKSSDYIDNGKYNILTIANVKGDRYIDASECNKIIEIPKDIQNHQILKINDILISLTGNVGRVSLVNADNCLLNQRVGVLSIIDENYREYIFQVISSKQFETKMILKGQGAAQKNIGNDDVESFYIPFSKKSLYINKLVNLFVSFDKKIAIEEQILNDYQSQKKYLLNNMFI